MSKTFKNIFIGILIGASLSLGLSTFASGKLINEIKLHLNALNLEIDDKTIANKGSDFELDNGEKVTNSILYKGTTYLPLRKIADIFAKEIAWDQETRTVSLKTNQKETTYNAEFNQKFIHEIFGKPKMALFGMYGDVYLDENESKITIYYNIDSFVKKIQIEDSKGKLSEIKLNSRKKNNE